MFINYMGGSEFQIVERCFYFGKAWDSDWSHSFSLLVRLSSPNCVSHVLANGANVCPKMFRQPDKLWIWFHSKFSSNFLTRRAKGMPTAWQIWRSSTKSSLRSPDSYLLTNDCGWPSRLAKSLCLNPASKRTCRSKICSFSCSALKMLFFIGQIPGRLAAYPKFGYG